MQKLSLIAILLAVFAFSSCKKESDQTAEMAVYLQDAPASAYEKIKIDNALKIMDLMSIETTLKRGFSITRRVDGTLVSNLKSLKMDDVIETELSDGRVKSRVV